MRRGRVTVQKTAPMLTRSAFTTRFAPRAVFGMVHLEPLPGAPQFRSLDEVIASALRDARAIAAGGCDGLAIENYGDKPFTRGRVEAETVAAMTRVIAEVTREVRLPFGVNVLRNDALSALAIAAATGAAFIRVNIHAGAMVTDQGIIEGDAYATLRKRAAIAPNVLIFADYLVKHATPLGETSAKDLRERGLADALIVTGVATGAAADPSRLRELREQVDAPLLLGSGLTADNASQFSDADAAIVGTSLKTNGAVDAKCVEAVVRAFKA
jgi:membrane complex biogenesis BtpA family protein